MNKNAHQIIDKTIREIKEKKTIDFHNVKGDMITVKSSNVCFVSDNSFDFFELHCIEVKESESFITFKLTI